MTQILRDWLRAEPGRAAKTFYDRGEFVVRLRDGAYPLSGSDIYGHHPDLDTARRLAVLNATEEMEAEDE
jgi:hypothetical protein